MKLLFKCLLPLLAVMVFAAAFSLFQSTRIVRLEISPTSLELAPGESIQLTAAGYTKDNNAVSEERMKRIDLTWGFRSYTHAFSVDENGLLTAHSPGIGNAWCNGKPGRINSRAITVSVIGPS